MKVLHGKLFQNIETEKIDSILYNSSQDYYALIRAAQKQGLRQSIITSDIMIAIAEHYLIHHEFIITGVEFLIDDDELQSEISPILNSLKSNSAYWVLLKEKLEFLSKNDSVDIKKIDFRSTTGLFSVQVNGIFSAPEATYTSFAQELSSVVEGCIR